MLQSTTAVVLLQELFLGPATAAGGAQGGALQASYSWFVSGWGSRASWFFCLVAIVVLGLLSRAIHTGLAIFDKYGGDALYAAMIYVILRSRWRASAAAVYAMVAMTALEFFQLTMIPLHMLASEHLIVRTCARLLGTTFSFVDLFTYAVGIGGIYLADRMYVQR